MNTYRYIAFDKNGARKRGTIPAESEVAAVGKLRGDGLLPAQLSLARSKISTGLAGSLRISKDGSDAELSRLSLRLSTLLDAGIPLETALEISSLDASKKMAAKIKNVRLAVIEGKKLSFALASEEIGFKPEALTILAAGETAGRTGEAFKRIGELMNNQAEFKAQISSSLTYPAILLFLALVSTAIVVFFLVPSLAPIFDGTGHEMPALMFAILVAGEFLRSFWQWILAGLLAASLAFLLTLNSPSQAAFWERLAIRTPIIGPLLSDFELMRFCTTISVLLRSGVPFLQALRDARNSCRLQYSRSRIDTVVERINEGQNVTEAFKIFDVMSHSDRQMITIGEKTNRIDNMFEQIGLARQAHAKRLTDRLLTLLPPVITISIGGFVALIIVTVMQAITSINNLALG